MRPFLLVLTIIRNAETRSLARLALSEAGHRVIEADGYAQAELLLKNALSPDLLVVEPSSTSSLETAQFRKFLKSAPVESICLLMRQDEKELRKEASDLGVKSFLTLPIASGDIKSAIDRFTEPNAQESGAGVVTSPATTALIKSNIPPDMPALPHLEELGENQYFLAASPAMLNIYRQVKLLADSDVPVLILGESGTGKEVVAHLIHKHSQRSRHKFLKVNCAALDRKSVV